MEYSDFLCNNIQCRQAIKQKGYITSCSHIFCIKCSDHYFPQALVCPACQTPLPETTYDISLISRDIFAADMQLSEEIKSMILTGQRPEVINEIAARAIAFWSYQVSQEHRIQEMISKKLQDNLSHAEKLLNSVTTQAKNEIEQLREQLSKSIKNLELEKKKNQELADQYGEKNKQLKKLQNNVEKMKRKSNSVITPLQSEYSISNMFNGESQAYEVFNERRSL